MGAHYSTSSSSSAAAAPSCESSDDVGGSPSYEPDKFIPSGAASIVPSSPMPVLARPETFEEKLYRKVSAVEINVVKCSCYQGDYQYVCIYNIEIINCFHPFSDKNKNTFHFLIL